MGYLVPAGIRLPPSKWALWTTQDFGSVHEDPHRAIADLKKAGAIFEVFPGYFYEKNADVHPELLCKAIAEMTGERLYHEDFNTWTYLATPEFMSCDKMVTDGDTRKVVVCNGRRRKTIRIKRLPEHIVVLPYYSTAGLIVVRMIYFRGEEFWSDLFHIDESDTGYRESRRELGTVLSYVRLEEVRRYLVDPELTSKIDPWVRRVTEWLMSLSDDKKVLYSIP